jgi:hypothetical protein
LNEFEITEGMGYFIPKLGFGLLKGEFYTFADMRLFLLVVIEKEGLDGEITGEHNMVI